MRKIFVVFSFFCMLPLYAQIDIIADDNNVITIYNSSDFYKTVDKINKALKIKATVSERDPKHDVGDSYFSGPLGDFFSGVEYERTATWLTEKTDTYYNEMKLAQVIVNKKPTIRVESKIVYYKKSDELLNNLYNYWYNETFKEFGKETTSGGNNLYKWVRWETPGYKKELYLKLRRQTFVIVETSYK